MARTSEIEALRKKRDIARAYGDEEGSIAVLARQYHASTRTVRAAVKHDAGWWQARIVAVEKARAPGPASRHVYQVLGLVHLSGQAGKPGYQLKNAAGEPVAMVEGTIDDVLGHLAAEGWEVLQLVPGGEGWNDVVVRRGAE